VDASLANTFIEGLKNIAMGVYNGTSWGTGTLFGNNQVMDWGFNAGQSYGAGAWDLLGEGYQWIKAGSENVQCVFRTPFDLIDKSVEIGASMWGHPSIMRALDNAQNAYLDLLIPGRSYIHQTQPQIIGLKYFGLNVSRNVYVGTSKYLLYDSKTGAIWSADSKSFGAATSKGVGYETGVTYFYPLTNSASIFDLEGASQAFGGGAVGVGINTSFSKEYINVEFGLNRGTSSALFDLNTTTSYTSIKQICTLPPGINQILMYILGMRARVK
jgi:hypothetical protein